MRYFLAENGWGDFRLNGFQRDAYAFSALATKVFYETFLPGVDPFGGIQRQRDRPIPNERERHTV